jgi:phosphoglycerate dehydrogenase-like enzyme
MPLHPHGSQLNLWACSSAAVFVLEAHMIVFLTRGALSIGSPWSHAVWAVLDHHRAMGVYRQQQRDHVYNRVTTSYTPTVSILVLGLGYMGTEIATKLATFGFDVRGWSRSHKDVANVACHAGQRAAAHPRNHRGFE